MGWDKVEGVVINHQRSRFDGKIFFSLQKVKEDLCKEYIERTGKESPYGLELDHIIPFSLCGDSSKGNLQVLKHRKHTKKSVIDRKIIKKFVEFGYLERVTNYSVGLKKPIAFLKKEYLKIFEKEKAEYEKNHDFF